MTDLKSNGNIEITEDNQVDALPDIVREADTGARSPKGHPALILLIVALSWALFQVWYASPLPFMTGVTINDAQARAIHLAFAMLLAFTAYPALKTSSRSKIPLLDWGLALVGAFCAGYQFLYYNELALRPGIPTSMDIITSGAGIILLLEAARRSLGLPLMMIAILALFYTLAGAAMPGIIAHKGASLSKMLGHQWLSSEGVYGIALGVSTGFVFLFVLFGALLDRVGAGNFFIKLAFSLLGHFQGGPAKAGVVASGLTGLISGSSVANVVTTGTFTIPLMKKVGFSSLKAGSIEAATGINGQIMPPVMGAAAFLMVDYVGISYGAVCRHAFLPAIISYIALMYTVHLEAVSANMRVLKPSVAKSIKQSMVSAGLTISGLIIFASITFFGVSFLKSLLGSYATWVLAIGLFSLYVFLIRYGAKYSPALEEEISADVTTTPEVAPIFKAGVYYLLPVVVLVWCLMVERLSPGLSAFWATFFLMFITLTQRPLMVLFRKEGEYKQAFREGIVNLLEGFTSGSRNMICIAVATATAGIIVGTVSLTGIGLKLSALVELLSGGNVIFMLCLTAGISLLLGMGLPTTANYIVVSTLMAPVLVELGAESGLIMPLIAVHLFVFYFGIMADVTPPVGLASFAASAISGADPIKTGFLAFFYSLRTVALPFMFIYNPQLLLIGIENTFQLVITIVAAIIAMLMFAAGLKGYFIVRSRLYETLALILIAFTLFRPGYWMDMVRDPYIDVPAVAITKVIAESKDESSLRMFVKGENMSGDISTKAVLLPLGPKGDLKERLTYAGMGLRIEKERVYVDRVALGKPAAKSGLKFDWEILKLQLPAGGLPKEIVFIPALLLLVLIVILQRRRKRLAELQPNEERA